MILLLSLWGCAHADPVKTTLPSRPPTVQADPTAKVPPMPEGTEATLALFGARHAEDLPTKAQLERHQAPSTLHWIASYAEHAQPRVLALRSLVGFPTPKTQTVCLASVDHALGQIRAATMVCLGAFDSKVAKAALEKGGHDTDERVRVAAQRALER